MKASTQRQQLNAIASAGPKNFLVQASYSSPANLKSSTAMSYREAKAAARAVREAGGWAVVARTLPTDVQFAAALGPCGK